MVIDTIEQRHTRELEELEIEALERAGDKVAGLANHSLPPFLPMDYILLGKARV